MLAQLLDCIWIAFSSVWEAVNSNFAIALIGGLTGAFGGALGAQHIVERGKRRDELLKELRNTNAATMAAFSACNAALALKKQHVQPMYEQFEREKKALTNFKAQRAAGKVPGNTGYHFVADLRTFPALVVPIETLKDLVFHKISAYGRALALVSVLEQSLLGLTEGIVKRDILIQRFSTGAVPAERLHLYYFGMPLPTGDTNQEYPDLVEAIHSYVDDVAFFSALLCSDLIAHGNRVHSAFTKRFGKGAPKVSTVDFSGPRQKGLIPPEAQYADWLNAFSQDDPSESEERRKK
jgi:hypothetical protein